MTGADQSARGFDVFGFQEIFIFNYRTMNFDY